MTFKWNFRAIGVFAVAIAVAIALAVGTPGTSAQEEAEAGGIVIGTYDPQQVAQQTGLQQKMMQQMQGLQQRAMDAQQSQDQQAMQQIQQEAQQIQQDVMNQFLQDVKDVMPQVAEETGVQIVAVDVAYMAEGMSEKDVTEEVIAQMGGGAAVQLQVPPQQ